MTEEQIDKLVWEIHTKADAKRILLAVAAEAREEGRKEGIDELCNSLSDRLRHGPQAGVALIIEDEAEQLKEKGK